jgi:hypothetical protein
MSSPVLTQIKAQIAIRIMRCVKFSFLGHQFGGLFLSSGGVSALRGSWRLAKDRVTFSGLRKCR